MSIDLPSPPRDGLYWATPPALYYRAVWPVHRETGQLCQYTEKPAIWPVLISLNGFFHWGKNAIYLIDFYCDLLRFFCDYFLGNQIRHQEKTEEHFNDLLPSILSFLGTVESSK